MGTIYDPTLPSDPLELAVPSDGDPNVVASINGAVRRLGDWLVQALIAPLFMLREVQAASGTFFDMDYNRNDASPYWIVCGNGDQVFISSDGITWSGSSTTGIGTLQAVALKDATSDWVVVSVNGVIWHSGALRTPAGGYSGDFNDIVWVPFVSLWVAVGETGEIQTSPDGNTWTHRALVAPAYTGSFQSVAHNGSIIVAVGDNGEIRTSTDGITWTKRTQAAPLTGNIGAVAWCGDKFVIGAKQGSAVRIQTSPDGITWTDRPVTYSGTDWIWDILFVDSWLIIALGDTKDSWLLSADGITWVEQRVELELTVYSGVANRGRLHVAREAVLASQRIQDIF